MKRNEASTTESGFDEHERDTAQRAYPKEIVDSARTGQSGAADGPPRPIRRPHDHATTKMPKFELEAVLRKESGTRPAVTTQEIERFMQRGAPPVAEDPHVRPTMTAVPRSILEAGEAGEAPLADAGASTTQPLVVPTPAPFSHESAISLAPPAPHSPPSMAAPESRLPRWVVPLVAAGVLVLVSVAFASGFLLGRLSMLR